MSNLKKNLPKINKLIFSLAPYTPNTKNQHSNGINNPNNASK
jgi:hypothetical protein